MISLLRQNISVATLLQLVVELSWLFVAGMVVIYVEAGGAKPLAQPR